MSTESSFGIIGGKGVYPQMFIDAARERIPNKKLVLIAFHGETKQSVADSADECEWFRVGQLGKMIKFFKKHNVDQCIMVGQVSPRNLFDLVPDLRLVKMLAKLKEKNADTLFKGIVSELAKDEITVTPATLYLEEYLCPEGLLCGPKIKEKYNNDVEYGIHIARAVSQLDIGQTVVVKDGTVLAVEAFEGTNDCLRRGAEQGKGKHCVLAKVAKKDHDFRFDVPCIGLDTIKNCKEAGISVIACEAGRTIILDKPEVIKLCGKMGVSIVGVK